MKTERLLSPISQQAHKSNLVMPFVLLLTVWLIAGTGLASDDLSLVLTHHSDSSGSLLPTIHTIAFPFEHYTHTLAYHYFGTHLTWGYEILKAVYAALSVWMTARFFSLYLEPWRAAFAAFIFIFLPNHDAAVYWFIGQYLILSISGYCYGFYLLRRNKPLAGTLLCTLASFISYGSTPIALSLGVLALLEKRNKDAALIVGPNILYTAYYFTVSLIFSQGPQRLPNQIDILALFKQFALQLLTFIDAQFGPSFWIKLLLSINEASVLGLTITCAAAICAWKCWEPSSQTTRLAPVAALSTTIVLALCMFAVTGKYPQIAFNLGDRVSIYGGLLTSYCLVSFFPKRLIATAIFTATVLAAAGLSNHWKEWTTHQNDVMLRIANNSALKNRPVGQVLLITGNQYSTLGPMSHIEFLSEGYVVNTLFKLVLDEDGVQYPKIVLNHRHSIEGTRLVDHKYGDSIPLPERVLIYDSQQDQLRSIARDDLNAYIESLPQDIRHWIQMLPPGSARDLVLSLMPRLKYAL